MKNLEQERETVNVALLSEVLAKATEYVDEQAITAGEMVIAFVTRRGGSTAVVDRRLEGLRTLVSNERDVSLSEGVQLFLASLQNDAEEDHLRLLERFDVGRYDGWDAEDGSVAVLVVDHFIGGVERVPCHFRPATATVRS